MKQHPIFTSILWDNIQYSPLSYEITFNIYLNPLLIAVTLDDPLYKYARQMYILRGDGTGLHYLFYLYYCDLTSFGYGRVEISSRFPVK